ncbi:MAG: M48 family metalloprotease [Pseudomonadota bacterium]
MASSFWRVALGVLSLGLMVSGCTTNPATGKANFTPFMTPDQELQIGAQEHPKLLQQFGGAYPDAKVSGYVAEVGARLAAESELPDLQFTFTTLNSKVINAFALPGGYVYMSRGLLAYMNDEAELASVLGHEIGHVTARHSARRYNKSIFSQVLGVGVGIATGSSELANLVNQSSQLYLLSYSRGQELEADELGVRYMSRVGYDPFGAPRMLETLGEASALDAQVMGRSNANQTPAWARTHPLTSERVRVALAEARQVSANTPEKLRRKNELLNAIDGMRIDDDPAQGIVDGQTFRHGQLGFAFSVPSGFAIENGSTAVRASGPGSSLILFTGGRAASNNMAQQAQIIWQSLTDGQAPALANMQNITVNGMQAATGNARIVSNGNTLDFRVVAINYGGGAVYSFIFIAPPNSMSQLNEPFRRTTYSFKRLSAAERAAVKGRVIKVITVQRGDTVQSLARLMAYDDYQVERFLVLNGLDDTPNPQLKAGERLKLVVYKN